MQCVPERTQRVSHQQRFFHNLLRFPRERRRILSLVEHCKRGKKCDVLSSAYTLSDGIVISHEWIERAELHPSRAQLFGCVTAETTNIRADVRDAEDIEAKNS